MFPLVSYCDCNTLWTCLQGQRDPTLLFCLYCNLGQELLFQSFIWFTDSITSGYMGLISKGSSFHTHCLGFQWLIVYCLSSSNSRFILNWLARTAVSIFPLLWFGIYMIGYELFYRVRVLYFLGWGSIIIFIIMLLAFWWPSPLLGQNISNRLWKLPYELQIGYFNKSGFGLPLSHFTPDLGERVNILLASKQAQSIQHSKYKFLNYSPEGKT